MSTLADPTAPLVASGNLRRRALISTLVEGGATTAALAAVAVLGLVILVVVQRGGSALSVGFLTKDLPAFGGSGGGIGPAIVGTIIIVMLATAIAMPIGVLVALYLTEFAGRRAAGAVKLALDLMNGLPTVVVGLFVFGLMVAGSGQSGFAGSVALSIVMLPLIARSSQEVLRRVPHTLREAADALGVSHWRTVVGVILPAALGGIVTGTILAVARAAGETAPLLFADSIFNNQLQANPFGQTVPNIPVLIFSLSESADPSGYSRAWGAAFVLLAFILLANIGARTLVSRGHTGGTR